MEFSDLSFFSVKNVIIVTLTVFILIIFKSRTQRNLPPGPNIFGIFQLCSKPYAFKYFQELTEQYGPIVRISLFGQPIIILGNSEVLKEAFVKHADNFVERPQLYALKEYSNFKGVAFSNGEIWNEHRKLVVNFLTKFDFQESIDNMILQETELFCNEINKKCGEKFDPTNLFIRITSNIIMLMTCSQRSDYNEHLSFFQENAHEIITNFQLVNPINFFPPLRYVLKSHRRYKQCLKNVKSYLMAIINDHESSLDENHIRDYIDMFLLKMKEDKITGTMDTTFTKEQLIVIIMDLYLAGGDSSATTLLWSILYLLYHPYLQTKIHKEIDDVIGCSRLPSMADCSKLHFTYATILETQRFANILPLGVPRQVAKSIKLQGYHIEKGAFVLSSFSAIHFDPKYWKEPLTFDPGRFLDENGTMIKNIKNFLPFGIGTRDCLGHSLARKELFLIFITLLQRYSFQSKESKLPAMTDCVESLVVKPLPFEVSFIQR